jgi:hypothetical protein
MKASTFCFRTGPLFAIAGMAMGIAMAASQDHSVMPAHAHLNLLGWVSLFLFGIYYKFHPAIDASRAALIQAGVWSVGTVVLTIGVAAVHMGHEAGDPVAAVGSLIILAGMIHFAVLVFRAAPSDRPSPAVLTPAE